MFRAAMGVFRQLLAAEGGRRRALRVRGWPHWVWPLAVCAIFSAVGILVLEDYAVVGDTIGHQRPIVANTVALVRGDADAVFFGPNRLYGVAFEILPFLAEQAFDADDTRGIYLSRHLITHLFYIVGGFCCYLLAYRMTDSRLLGLFAMLLFLLHPRMYAHSFFNSKDIPFMSMFMIALCSVHWAFRKGTVAAFLICGAAVAILVNIRIMGVMLLPAVLAMRACDVYYAAGWAERRRVISSGTAFALAALAIYYASMPYLWSEPLARFGEIVASFSRHTVRPFDLFQGQYVYSASLPASYLPVWIGITTPVWALLLAGLGAVGICGRTVTQVRSGAVLRNTGLRFELLLAACAALPIIGVIVLQSVMYDDWRHTYFLWAPLCLLAVMGLRQLGNGLAALARYFGAGWYRILARAALAALAALALAGTAAELIRLHPYQHLYFNLLVDRTTPEYLKTQYETDQFHTARREGHRYILDNDQSATIQLERRHTPGAIWRFLETFTESDRRRFRYDPATDADYYVINRVSLAVNSPGLPTTLLPPVLYNRALYSNTIMSVATPDLSRVDPAVADTYRELYRTAARQEPTLRAGFNFYRNDQTLTLVNEDCPSGALSGAYQLRVYPADPGNLPKIYRGDGYNHAALYGVRFDGKCLMQATLPDYAIARIVVVGIGEILSADYLAELRQQYAALQASEPAIQSDFAVYVGAGALHYTRDECRLADTEAPFFLHIIPADLADLPADRQEHGYGNYDFQWDYHSIKGNAIVFDDKCMATVELPDYAIHSIHTGQFVPGAERLWSGEFYTGAYQAVRAAELAALAVGMPEAQDFFNVYHGNGALTYIREDCAAVDTAAAFYLHLFPADADDLPAGRREHGFDNRDFAFDEAGGVQYAGRCLVSVPLPDYAIDRIHTGQYAPGAGQLWGVEFGVGN